MEKVIIRDKNSFYNGRVAKVLDRMTVFGVKLLLVALDDDNDSGTYEFVVREDNVEKI